MSITYPFQGNTAEMLYQNIESSKTGHYPVGIGHFWHGGVHLTIPAPVRAICDGDVVAYRINEDYLEDLALAQWDETDNKYSTGFVLIRHQLKYPPESDKTITFFSLYMHLLPWNLYGKREKENIPSFFKTTRYYAKREMNIRDASCTEPNFDPSTAEKLGSICINEELFFKNEEDLDKKMSWDATFRYRHLDPEKHGYDAGYIHVPSDNYRKEANTPMEFAVGDDNNIVIPDPPMPVKCGEIIGYPGNYEQDNMIHFEIFMEDVSFMDNPDDLKKDDPEDAENSSTGRTRASGYYTIENGIMVYHCKTGNTVGNLYNWIDDYYFKRIEDIDDDCYCDVEIMKDLLIKLGLSPSTDIKTVDNLPALFEKPEVMHYCRTIVSRHATEWSKKTDKSTKKWDLLVDDDSWDTTHDHLESVLTPHFKRLYWWDQLEEAKVEGVPKDPKRLWYFHPIAFISHLKKIFPSTIELKVTRKKQWAKNSSATENKAKQGGTISEFTLLIDKIEKLKGYILEAAGANSKVKGSDQRIMPGTYYIIKNPGSKGDFRLVQKTKEQASEYFGNRGLCNVHIGNYPTDIEGCFAPGSDWTIKNEGDINEYPMVTNSTTTYNKLKELILNNCIKEKAKTYDGEYDYPAKDNNILYSNIKMIIKEDFDD